MQLTGRKFVAGNDSGTSTCAADFTRCRETSKRVTGRIAVFPARNPSALAPQPKPKAVTIPAPVMTMRG